MISKIEREFVSMGWHGIIHNPHCIIGKAGQWELIGDQCILLWTRSRFGTLIEENTFLIKSGYFGDSDQVGANEILLPVMLSMSVMPPPHYMQCLNRDNSDNQTSSRQGQALEFIIWTLAFGQ